MLLVEYFNHEEIVPCTRDTFDPVVPGNFSGIGTYQSPPPPPVIDIERYYYVCIVNASKAIPCESGTQNA
ncbi:hypothetical protein CBS147344_8095 [Aspergillus niger]|nr:hypothetical protein CBS147344_8095 [Aspergillus niger]